jgi:hypothetical protein
MTEQEIEAEIKAREEEINIRQDKLDTWDKDCYISDEDTEPYVSKTTRITERMEYISRKRSRQNLPTQGQELSILEESQRQVLRQQLDRHDQRNRSDLSLWDVSTSDESSYNSEEDVNRGIDNDILELPSHSRPEASQNRRRKRSGRDILNCFSDKRQRQM